MTFWAVDSSSASLKIKSNMLFRSPFARGRILAWLESCGYSKEDAKVEAERMIKANQWDGVEMCSREFAIEMILENIA